MLGGFFTYFYLFLAVLKLGHWKVNAEIDSKSVPPYLLKLSKSSGKHPANLLASDV